jgi:hypothetical protein
MRKRHWPKTKTKFSEKLKNQFNRQSTKYMYPLKPCFFS